jgi:hypothetical protein
MQMSRVIHSRNKWNECLEREYPGVLFEEDDRHPPGVNAVKSGVLVGRFYSGRDQPFGLVFDQPRSCGGRN